MTTRFHLDFRILEQKEPRGCSAVLSEWDLDEHDSRTMRAGPGSVCSVFVTGILAALLMTGR